MITPDFIGQIYKDTATGNLWRANSMTPGDWTLELQNGLVKWGPTSEPFPEQIGYFTYGNASAVTSLTFEQESSLSGFDLEYFDNLVTLSFPNLVSIDPTATYSGYFYCTQNPELTTIDLSALEEEGGGIDITDNNKLATLNLSSLVTSADFNCSTNPLLTTLDLSSLTTVAGNLTASNNATLTSIVISSLNSLGGNVNFSVCALTEASINAILAQLVSIVTYGAGKSVQLNGGTNAAPTGQGVIDAGALTGRGATVVTN